MCPGISISLRILGQLILMLKSKIYYLFNAFYIFRLDDMKELDLSLYGLGQNDELESLQGLLHGDSTSIKTLSDVRSYLSTVYCGSMAVDFSGIEVNFLMKHSPFTEFL